MIVEINGKTQKKYPYIGISETKNIVLFLGPKEGILLKGGILNTEPPMHHSEEWYEDNFELFDGVVTLKNK